jgi:hypothetical protein
MIDDEERKYQIRDTISGQVYFEIWYKNGVLVVADEYGNERICWVSSINTEMVRVE